jgi:hypothetical protein
MSLPTMWIIDDSLPFLKLYEIVFKDEYDVKTFSRAGKAFELLDEGTNAPDVCICDYHFREGMQGDEFFRRAAKYFGKTAKYLLSAEVFWEHAGVPVNGVVPVKKPVDNDILREQIKSDLEMIASGMHQ